MLRVRTQMNRYCRILDLSSYCVLLSAFQHSNTNRPEKRSKTILRCEYHNVVAHSRCLIINTFIRLLVHVHRFRAMLSLFKCKRDASTIHACSTIRTRGNLLDQKQTSPLFFFFSVDRLPREIVFSA